MILMSSSTDRWPDPQACRPRVRRATLVGALLSLGILLAGCGSAPAADGRTQVVTSFYPLQYVAQRIAGPHADVSNLTHPGQEPHDLELSVKETASVVDADVVVYERGFQAAIDEAVDQIRPARVVDASVAAGLSGDDPHFWLDPTRLSAVAVAVERQLAAADPAHAAGYARNLRSLRADLAALDRSYRTGLATCRLDTIVVSHDAFGYLGRRYGLRVVGINGLSPDAEPSPSHIQALQRPDLLATGSPPCSPRSSAAASSPTASPGTSGCAPRCSTRSRGSGRPPPTRTTFR